MVLGINGLGRMGRTILRLALRRGHTIKILNDVAKWEILAYLINFDTTHGSLGNRCECHVFYEGTTQKLKIVYTDKENQEVEQDIIVRNAANPRDIDFGENNNNQAQDIDVMIESSGKFLDSSSLACYLTKGVRKVIMSAPPRDNTPTFVLGVNAHHYNGEKIISNASCTTNCIAPICFILDKHYGIENAVMTTIHSYTNDQNLLDNAHRFDKRRSRSAPNNIIPTSTGAAIGLKKVLPSMEGKIHGQSLRVPVADVSMADLSFYLREEVNLDSLHELLESYAKDSMAGILSLDTKERVSSDFLGSSYSSIIAQDLSIKIGKLVKIMSWYDNETGYANRILDMAEFINRQHQ
ncbi:type I glyceraldehyde-3-phosphate dehydrogenase [Helicobacter sp. MIT 14-3879]|uniref:type I glyceraldehyde-3-phosphate dehydrogenase n=1 Tax=Helicobacter sp. MIT 14-3879 TaxID=2040649 RepID=UPI000E1F11C0|nr:glyceraldehyde 3-phosphate dehydrogenase NAD-binding domain-containing protein [Helicobacter sp. MIT 14-3879]RDU60860.1 type I glyceraldehyde-3-phosphate dehydrogenase [Helicobacter sp. MIT 14-3879]